MTAYIILALSFLGVILGGRPFAKLQWAHIYLFDWIAAVWLLTSLSRITKQSVVDFVKANKWIVLYFLYGLFLLFIDFFSSDFKTTPFNRVAQHSIIFVYPLIWVFIGFESVKINPNLTSKVVISILISYFTSHVLYIFFPGSLEFSIGFVIIVFIIDFLSRNSRLENFKGLLLLPVLFIPFWQMWGSYVSRTGLLELLLSIILLPFVIFRRNCKRSFWISAGMLLILLVGFAVVSENRSASGGNFVQRVRSDFFQGTLHGDDLEPSEPSEHVYHARFRTYVWKTTLSDWWERPLLGRGFIPEIPSALEPGVKNIGGYFHVKDAPPVSGAHNSYLTILARMGPIGLGLLLLALGSWFKKGYDRKGLLNAALFVIPLFELFRAFFNIGIEAPQSSVILWFCYGIGLCGWNEKCNKELIKYRSVSNTTYCVDKEPI